HRAAFTARPRSLRVRRQRRLGGPRQRPLLRLRLQPHRHRHHRDRRPQRPAPERGRPRVRSPDARQNAFLIGTVCPVAELTERTQAWVEAGTFTEVGGNRIFVRERSGDAERAPLLFLHGYPSSSYDWRHAFEKLGGRRLLVFDFLGYGLSDKPRDQLYSLSIQADIVEA